MSEKIYVLDTNVLIFDPKALFSFEGAHVGIPIMVLEELDQMKTETTERGRNAREVATQLDALREKGSLKNGVKLSDDSTIRILFSPSKDKRPDLLAKDTEDNTILLTAYALKEKGDDVIFISKDINARVKADVLGLKSEDYLKGRVSEYDIYKGWGIIEVPSVQLTKPIPQDILQMGQDGIFEINEYILVQSTGNPFNNKVFRYLGEDKFKHIQDPTLKWPIYARNPQQLMTLDLLLDPAIQIACLICPAGTGKTFLALVAGLQQVLVEDIYRKILISRPVVPLGPDIGYLPGDIQEKLHSWMQPMYDNMSIIVHSAESRKHLENVYSEHGKKQFYKGKKYKKPSRDGLGSLDDMIFSGKISLEAITYMRGRSIPYQYILIDEVQNLTPHEVKTIITRVGEGSKIVLSGDPYQIDSPYLDFQSNGLVVSSNAFKGQKMFGTVFLETTERSELSRLAGELL